MQTAYALHISDGVPTRVIVSTEVRNTLETMIVRVTHCDFTWKELPDTTRSYTRNVGKPKWFWQPDPEIDFHRKLRSKMEREFNWRFELYNPFSD